MRNDCGNSNQLRNPDINPQVISLKGTSTAASTQFNFADSCGLATDFALITPAPSGVEMVWQNGLSATGFRCFTQTYALVVKEYRFLAQDDADLSNNLNAIHVGIDGNNQTEVVFSSDAVSPFQNNPNLLVIKRPFVWTSTTALKIQAVSAISHDYTFTFTIATMIPYGQLDAFLAQNPIMKSGN